jgi:hypothetical protein
VIFELGEMAGAPVDAATGEAESLLGRRVGASDTTVGIKLGAVVPVTVAVVGVVAVRVAVVAVGVVPVLGGRVSLVMGELLTGEGVTGLAVGASDGDADTGA